MDELLHIDKFNSLLSMPFFSSLSSEQLKQVALIAGEQTISSGEVLFRQGDIGDSLYIITSGQVKIFRTSSDGLETLLAHRGPGDSIGEMALLTDEPRSASVQATEDSALLVVTKHDFDQLLGDNLALAQIFVKIVAGRLRKADMRIEQGASQELALRDFLSQQHHPIEAELIGTSRSIRTLNKAIEELESTESPTLVTGEVGTEHAPVAQLIHEKSPRKEQTVFIIDCATIPALMPISGSQETQEGAFIMEVSQESAIFGHEAGVFSFARTRRLGYLEVAHSGTLVLENIDKLQKSVQQKLVDYLRDGSFLPRGSNEGILADVRIIATTSIDLLDAVAEDRFDRQLYQQLSAQSVSIPPLRDRKRDLSAIVQHFVGKHNREAQKEIKGVTSEAMNLIMRYDWPGNVEELEDVVRRGVHIAQDEMIAAQEIFIGLQPMDGEYRFNLFRFDRLHQVFSSRLFPAVLQFATVAFFGLILVLGLFGVRNPTSNIVLILTWAIWWPMLMVSFLLAARFWCTVCPIAAIAGAITHFYTLGLKVPSFLRKYGIYFSMAGFIIIVWAEQITHMNASPLATAFLLIGILTAATVTGLLFERRAWCRYLCPLGGMAGVFASTSVIEFRGNLDVCRNECKTHACFVGTDKIKGCPMYQGAFSLQSNEHCVLCGNCIKICESKSPRINLRPPAMELAASGEQSSAGNSRLGLAVFVPVLIGSLLAREFEKQALYGHIQGILGSNALSALAVLIVLSLVTFGVLWVGGVIAIRKSGRFTDRFLWLALAFIPLAFAGELSHQLARLLLWAGQLIPTLGRQIGVDYLQRFGIQATPAMVHGFQFMVILLGAITTLVVGKRSISNYTETQSKSPIWMLRALVLMLSVTYFVWFIAQ